MIIELAQAAVGEAVGGGGTVGAIFIAYKLFERYVLDKRNGGGRQAEQVAELHKRMVDPNEGMIVVLNAINQGIREIVVELRNQRNGKGKG